MQPDYATYMNSDDTDNGEESRSKSINIISKKKIGQDQPIRSQSVDVIKKTEPVGIEIAGKGLLRKGSLVDSFVTKVKDQDQEESIESEDESNPKSHNSS